MTEHDERLKHSCTKILSGHRQRRPDEWLRDLASLSAAREPADVYGVGGAVTELEQRTATLLDKEQGLFVMKGMTAQMTVLKRLAELRSTASVALHPLSHMMVDEGSAVQRVGGLTVLQLGRFATFGLEDLRAVDEPLAAVIVELPLRRAGCLLPPLQELKSLSAYCRERNIPLHFDGARLWESAAGYGVKPGELAALADSVYVSFYKGLGGLGGSVVCGTSDFINSLGAWKARLGGNLFTSFPYALSALSGLEKHLPRMGHYVERARQLASDLAGRFLVNPTEPHTNAFQLLLPGNPGELAGRNTRFGEKHGVWLFNAFGDAPLDGHSTGEVVIGDNSDDWTNPEASTWLEIFISEIG